MKQEASVGQVGMEMLFRDGSRTIDHLIRMKQEASVGQVVP
jgi:hypothetical protein